MWGGGGDLLEGALNQGGGEGCLIFYFLKP